MHFQCGFMWSSPLKSHVIKFMQNLTTRWSHLENLGSKTGTEQVEKPCFKGALHQFCIVSSLAKSPRPSANPHLLSSAFVWYLTERGEHRQTCLPAPTLDFLLTWCNLAASKPPFVLGLNTPFGYSLTSDVNFTTEHFSKAYCLFFHPPRQPLFMSAPHENQHAETWSLFEWGDPSLWTNVTSAFVVGVTLLLCCSGFFFLHQAALTSGSI